MYELNQIAIQLGYTTWMLSHRSSVRLRDSSFFQLTNATSYTNNGMTGPFCSTCCFRVVRFIGGNHDIEDGRERLPIAVFTCNDKQIYQGCTLSLSLSRGEHLHCDQMALKKVSRISLLAAFCFSILAFAFSLSPAFSPAGTTGSCIKFSILTFKICAWLADKL